MTLRRLGMMAAGLVLLGVGGWALAKRPWDHTAPAQAALPPNETLAAASEPAVAPPTEATNQRRNDIPPGWRRDAPYLLYSPPASVDDVTPEIWRSFHHSPVAEAEAVQVILDVCRMLRSAKTTKEEVAAYLGRTTDISDLRTWEASITPRSEIYSDAELSVGRRVPGDPDGTMFLVSLQLTDPALLSLHTLRKHFGKPEKSEAIDGYPSVRFAWREQPAGDYRCEIHASINWDGEDREDPGDDPNFARVFRAHSDSLGRGIDEKKIWMLDLTIDRMRE